MVYDQQTLNVIFKKTDGRCHICRKKLARKNYGFTEGRGVWEVDHSVPQSAKGTHHLNNLLPAHPSCNRSRKDLPTKTARGKHGFRSAPLSKKKKIKNALWGTLAGGTAVTIAARVLLIPLGPPGVVAGMVLGAVIGFRHEPK